ncbi:glycoside hydrolase family 88 protein [Mucilaginibacter sp. PAMB04168]|uniref:glycoside hydrolase family 88/105 protein n=1 Tax=Mucilaginibacter sp. PAMB04168 TaxID=3138567 RepID=UPI0031F5FFB7
MSMHNNFHHQKTNYLKVSMTIYFKRSFRFFLTLVLLWSTTISFAKESVGPLSKDSIKNIMQRVADWQWRDIEVHGWKNPPKDWTSGAMFTGMVAWAKIAPDKKYWNKLVQVGELNQWKIGPRRRFADDYCVGQMYSLLYKKFKNPDYIADFRSLADTLAIIPHTEPLLWVNSIYLREWAWCDALFMAPPALAYLSDATKDKKYLNLASRLWWKTSDYLYSNEEHLFFRDSRYFTQKEKNGKPVFWSRGNGWVLGGIANVLSVMPARHPDRARFIKQFKEMAERIAGLQQPDGTWHASLLDPESYPVKETSGTAFFCYALAWGINHHILPHDKYYPVAVKAWQSLVACVHPDGKLGYVQPQGVSPEKVTSDDTEYYGVGAFLLAGTEMVKLKSK